MFTGFISLHLGFVLFRFCEEIHQQCRDFWVVRSFLRNKHLIKISDREVRLNGISIFSDLYVIVEAKNVILSNFLETLSNLVYL